MYLRSANLIIVSSVLGALATVFVVLRFCARSKWRSRIGLDDYLIVAGLILAIGVCICTIIGAARFRFGNHEIYRGGSGPLKDFPLPWLLLGYGKIFFSIELLHCCAMPSIKISLLMFLNRIFGSSPKMKLGLWIVGTYVVLWWLVTFFMTIFQCWPITSNWGTSPAEMGNCIPNYKLWYAWMALLNVLSDVAVTILPVPAVIHLQISTSKKIGILAILSNAAAVIIAGVGRTVSYFKNERTYDFTYANYDYLMWTAIEPCLGLVGVCAVSLGRLVDVKRSAFYRSLFSHFSFSSNRSSRSEKSGRATSHDNASSMESGKRSRYKSRSRSQKRQQHPQARGISTLSLPDSGLALPVQTNFANNVPK